MSVVVLIGTAEAHYRHLNPLYSGVGLSRNHRVLHDRHHQLIIANEADDCVKPTLEVLQTPNG